MRLMGISPVDFGQDMTEEGSRIKRERPDEALDDNAVALEDEEPPRKQWKRDENENVENFPEAEAEPEAATGHEIGVDQGKPETERRDGSIGEFPSSIEAYQTVDVSNQGGTAETGECIPEANGTESKSLDPVPDDGTGYDLTPVKVDTADTLKTSPKEQVYRPDKPFPTNSKDEEHLSASFTDEKGGDQIIIKDEHESAPASDGLEQVDTSTKVQYTLEYDPPAVEPSTDDYAVEAAAAQTPLSQSNNNLDSAIVEERGEVPAIYIGRVIGKGGEMIRDLQARAGCRMDVDPNASNPGASRIITYRGTRKTVDFAKRLVQMLCNENVAETDLPLGEAHRKHLVIPAHTVGKIIGRGGEMIRELQSRSQARIQVDHSGTSGLDPGQKQVTITGSEAAVVKAEEMVLFLVNNPMMDALNALNMLVEDKLHRGGAWGSGPPYPNFPNQGQNMQPPAGGPPGYGGGYDQSPGPGNYPPNYSPQQSPAMASGPMPGYMPNYGAPPVGPEMELFRTPRVYLGRIIGAKGVTINDLQRRSGCDIQINQDVPHGQDCEISIRGPRHGIDMVKQMIREIIDIGPNHPYAGGADQAGYGHGGYNQGGYQQGYGYAPQPYGYQSPPMPQPGYGQPYDAPYQPPFHGYPGPGPYDQGQVGGYYRPPNMHQPYPAAGQPPYGYEPPHPVHPQVPPITTAWKSATAPDGQVYYYNERTGETQWEKPMGYP